MCGICRHICCTSGQQAGRSAAPAGGCSQRAAGMRTWRSRALATRGSGGHTQCRQVHADKQSCRRHGVSSVSAARDHTQSGAWRIQCGFDPGAAHNSRPAHSNAFGCQSLRRCGGELRAADDCCYVVARCCKAAWALSHGTCSCQCLARSMQPARNSVMLIAGGHV